MREMKDSGIEWIGEIPKEWEISTIKQEYLFQTGGTPKTDIESYFEGENIWVNISDMKSKFITDSAKHISDDAVNSTSMSISPKGSLLYAFKLSVGAVAFCEKDMYTNEAIATFLSCNNSLEYLYYMAPIFIIMNANENIYGAKLLNQKLIKNAKIIIPPLAEQQKISAYLDTKCTKIDSIIEKQEKIIEKLKAYKLSVITEAVTKGLNPDVKMKDSGVEWIGEIPEHWDIVKLGNIFSYLGGYAYNSDLYTPESDYQVLRIGNVKNYHLILENNPVYINKETAIETSKYKLKSGTILFTMTGTKGKRDYFFTHLLTDSDLSHKHLYLNQRVGCLIPIKDICPGYYNYLLKDFRILDSIFLYETGTANQGNLGIESIKRTVLQHPSLQEQHQIADYLDQKCYSIDKSIKQKLAIIEKLKEYKKSLIYEVVTGKKEV